jgi:signal transduction histidine kinase/ActR/RegA family two-component response regulator
MAFLAGVVLWRVNAQVSTTRWVEHSDEVLLRAKDAQLDFAKMRLAFRGYMTSSDKAYLAELRKATSTFEKDIEEIAALVTDNPDQERRIIRVSEMYVPGRFEELVQQRESGTLRSDPLAQAHAYSQQVLDAMDAFIVAEYRLRAQRSARQTGLDQAIIVMVPVFSALIAVVLSYAGWRQIGQASQQFAAALTRAEEANRAKDNFLATVSHELRNPLNAIMLLTSILLSDQEVHEGARQRVKAIDRAARTQAQLIEDLLDVSRIESGRLRLDVQATDLAKVVKAAADSMRVAAEAKSISLHDIIDTSVSLIAGDPKRLEQVVWNLLSNAIKFTPKGGKVQVRLERINSHVEIIVTDNGQGIAPSSVPYVFDRFWQETESGRSRPGVGLGLSIVKELVALHGGTVMAHSDGIGKGSTFTVRLPLPPATAPLLEPRRHPTVAPVDDVATASRLDGLSILVVDDEPEACEALTKLLGSLGARVYAEHSAEAALSMLDRTRPDAIVADIEMPVQNGFFFAREVRNREQDRKADGRVPLIALTAYGRIEDKVKILASGFESHVVKPVDLAELSATIRTLIAARAT